MLQQATNQQLTQEIGEGHTIRQKPYGLQDVFYDHRFEDIELK